MVPWCEAYVPLAALGDDGEVIGAGLVPCKAPAAAVYEYFCANGHTVIRSVCREHDPVPGDVGCHACKAEGLEVPMTWQLVEVGTGTMEG